MTKHKIQPPTVKKKTDSQKKAHTQEKVHAAGDHGGTRGSQKVAGLLARVLPAHVGSGHPRPQTRQGCSWAGIVAFPRRQTRSPRASEGPRRATPGSHLSPRQTGLAKADGEGTKSPGTWAGVGPECPAPSSASPPAPAVALQDNGCPAVTRWCGGSPRPASDPGPPSLPLSPLPSAFPPVPRAPPHLLDQVPVVDEG